MVHHQFDTGQPQRHPVGKLDHIVGLGEGQPAEQLLAHLQREALGGVGEQVAVGRVDVGGNALGTAHGRYRPDVVDVAMGRQHRHRPQAVLGEQFRDTRLGVLPGVDDDALLPRARGHHIAVGGE